MAARYVAASQAAHWDGKTETGEPVGSGTYFYQQLYGNQKDGNPEISSNQHRNCNQPFG